MCLSVHPVPVPSLQSVVTWTTTEDSKKKENKLACQNIIKKKRDSAKQGELVVKETVQDQKMEIIL